MATIECYLVTTVFLLEIISCFLLDQACCKHRLGPEIILHLGFDTFTLGHSISPHLFGCIWLLMLTLTWQTYPWTVTAAVPIISRLTFGSLSHSEFLKLLYWRYDRVLTCAHFFIFLLVCLPFSFHIFYNDLSYLSLSLIFLRWVSWTTLSALT